MDILNVPGFSKMIKYDQNEDIIICMKNFFDQHIAMYSIVKECRLDFDTVYFEPDNSTYILIFKDCCLDKSVIDSLDNKTVVIYKQSFIVSVIKKGKDITISLK